MCGLSNGRKLLWGVPALVLLLAALYAGLRIGPGASGEDKGFRPVPQNGELRRLLAASYFFELPNAGRPPDFSLMSLEGDQVRLSRYRGKAVLLNFWATW